VSSLSCSARSSEPRLGRFGRRGEPDSFRRDNGGPHESGSNDNGADGRKRIGDARGASAATWDEAYRSLFKEIYGYWTTLPRDNRSRLYLHGLSLGAKNSEQSTDLIEVEQTSLVAPHMSALGKVRADKSVSDDGQF